MSRILAKWRRGRAALGLLGPIRSQVDLRQMQLNGVVVAVFQQILQVPLGPIKAKEAHVEMGQVHVRGLVVAVEDQDSHPMGLGQIEVVPLPRRVPFPPSKRCVVFGKPLVGRQVSARPAMGRKIVHRFQSAPLAARIAGAGVEEGLLEAAAAVVIARTPRPNPMRRVLPVGIAQRGRSRETRRPTWDNQSKQGADAGNESRKRQREGRLVGTHDLAFHQDEGTPGFKRTLAGGQQHLWAESESGHATWDYGAAGEPCPGPGSFFCLAASSSMILMMRDCSLASADLPTA